MDRLESFAPTVHRILAGAFTGDGEYAVLRRRGTTDWLLINTVAGHGRFGTAAGQFLTTGTGDLVLIRAGTPHDYGTAPGHRHWDLQFANFHRGPTGWRCSTGPSRWQACGSSAPAARHTGGSPIPSNAR